MQNKQKMLESLRDPKNVLEEGPGSDRFKSFVVDVETVAMIIIRMSYPGCRLDLSIQDAGYFAAIDLNACSGVLTELRFSLFGKLVTITNDWSLLFGYLTDMVAVLEEYGFTYISETILGEKFCNRQRFNEDWFHSYFDYA